MAIASSTASLLRAGAAMIDITPQAGTHLGGDLGFLRPAEVIEERLYARALVLESNGRKLCIASPDLEIVMEKYSRPIREGASQRCGIHPDNVMVHLAQAHSVPPLGNFLIDEDLPNIPPEHEYLRGSQSEYCLWAVERTIRAIEEANANLRPVGMAAGSAVRDDLAFNRRAVMRDGKVRMPWFYAAQHAPLGPTDLRHVEGPMDPEVGVVCFRDDAMQMVAMLLHHTCHPVNVYAQYKNTVSPDWPGTWAFAVQREHGAQCVPIVLNGCCGNINPWPPFAADFVPDHRRMGQALADTTQKIVRTLRFGAASPLDCRSRHIKLPVKQASPAVLQAAERMLAQHPAPIWEGNPPRVPSSWMDAAMVMSVELERRRAPLYDYEIQVFRVGDLALVGLPGEPFVEGQLAIKIGSPAYPTYVAHGTTDYAGYIAPIDCYPRGGHEIREIPAKWAKLAPGALESIVEATVGTLKEVFAPA